MKENKILTKIKSTLKVLGPGLVTGSSDDDPSGIATYSQVGAQFSKGYNAVILNLGEAF